MPLARICPRLHRSDVLHLPFNPFTAHPRVGRRLPGRFLNLITALEVHKGTESPPGRGDAALRSKGLGPVWLENKRRDQQQGVFGPLASRATWPLPLLRVLRGRLEKYPGGSLKNEEKVSFGAGVIWTLRNSPLL